jgi:glycosyltransferase involved in cell wall biosynthesis
MIGANKDWPARKSFQEALDAFKLFLEGMPKALLYIHSNPEFPGGFNFKQYADFIGIGDKLLIPDAYETNFNTSKEVMARIYNTFDVLLMPSISEGFGIPAIEAQSCGVPVIVNNFTSMPELVKPGITGEICELIKGPSGKRFSPQGSYFGIPDTLSLVEKMMAIYRADTGLMKKAARDWIVETMIRKRSLRRNGCHF